MTEDQGKWLDVRTVQKLIPYAKAAGVSKVALSSRGFIAQFLPGGKRGLDLYWFNRRNGFVARHLAQVGPNTFVNPGGVPTRRMLALAMWAYGDKRVVERFLTVTPAEYARLVRKG